MHFLRCLFVLLLSSLICAGSVLSAKPSPFSIPSESGAKPQLNRLDAEAWFDGLMPSLIKNLDMAGAVVVVVKDGQILVQKGYGFSDTSKKIAVDAENTLFRPGSVSKLFTWTAIMQLVEQGKIDLDADINEYIDFKVQGRGGKIITVRHLMTHRAGFEESVKELLVFDQPNLVTGAPILKRWVPKRIFDPGATPAYSNYGAGLAGYIVERVSGVPFEAYVERNIFNPLKMSHSTFRQPLSAAQKSAMSQGYESAGDVAKGYEFINLPAAGSLASNSTDMAHFMIAHLQQGRYGTTQILKPDTAQLMHGTATNTITPLNRMLLGFYEKNVDGYRVIGHGGDTLLFHSDLNLFLDENVGIFISFNSRGTADGSTDPRPIILRKFADRYLLGASNQTASNKVDAVKDAQKVEGVFSSTRRSESNFLAFASLLSTVDIISNDDGSIIVGPGADEEHFIHIGPMLWQKKNSTERLAAKIENGIVTEISFDSVAPIFTFQKVSNWRSGKAMIYLFSSAVGILLLSGLSWPIAAIVRGYNKAPFPYAGSGSSVYRLSRICALITIAIIGAWVAIISGMDTLNYPTDSLLISLQWVSLILFSGLLIITIWNFHAVWRGKGSWIFKLKAAILASSALIVCWFGYAGGLFSMSTNY